MPRRELNNHNTAKKNGYLFGHSDNLITLSLSLSQVLTYNSLYIIKIRGCPRQDTAFLANWQVLEQRMQRQTCLHFAESRQNSTEGQGKPMCFLSPNEFKF